MGNTHYNFNSTVQQPSIQLAIHTSQSSQSSCRYRYRSIVLRHTMVYSTASKAAIHMCNPQSLNPRSHAVQSVKIDLNNHHDPCMRLLRAVSLGMYLKALSPYSASSCTSRHRATCSSATSAPSAVAAAAAAAAPTEPRPVSLGPSRLPAVQLTVTP